MARKVERHSKIIQSLNWYAILPNSKSKRTCRVAKNNINSLTKKEKATRPKKRISFFFDLKYAHKIWTKLKRTARFKKRGNVL